MSCDDVNESGCTQPCRRRFLVSTSSAVVALTLPIVGCGEHDVDTLGNDVELLLADYPELEEVGVTAFVDFDEVALPLAITRTEGDEFIVTGTECNHSGCGVSRSGGGFKCPCHGATFRLDGSLRKGPATEGLIAYDYEVVDGTMKIFAS